MVLPGIELGTFDAPLGYVEHTEATIEILRVKNDHRSEFSKLSNWKEEA